jgi:4-amino-4-deoxy-L-arabinose transferase-like glycosyltransferase
MGLLGRRIASPRAGLVAAGIAAVYPNFWLNDGLVMSETLVILTTAVVVLAAYRFWQAPRRATAIALGATLGLAALTRAEDILLVPLVVIPLAFVVRRVRLAVLACAVAALVLAPWTIYNLTRFSRPVLLTNGLGPTLQVSYCNRTFYGSFTGYWSFPCISTVPLPRGDESVQSDFFRARAVKYARAHEARLPVVVLARVGRAWALYRPGQQITLDRIETRELWASRVGLGMYYVLALASVGGVVALRRRRVPVFPLLALVATVTVTVAVTFGQTRYRAAAEVAVVALAAVAIDAVLSRRVARPPELASVAFEPDEQPAGTAPLPVL